MAKNVATARAFLDDLQTKLKVLATQELQELQKLKAEELLERGEHNDGLINSYDFKYYH